VNAIDQARAAYAPAQSATRTGRSAELGVFTEVTNRLRRAMAEGPAGFASLAAALHDNRRLWTRLAADVSDDGNGLPRMLRAQLFYLSEFTEHHSRRVLRGDAGAEALVDINLSVMRGLSDYREGARPEAAVMPQRPAGPAPLTMGGAA
jgi:flagellar biosynthesis activator protein FlaF